MVNIQFLYPCVLMHVCNLALRRIAHHRFDQWLFNGSTDGIKSNHTNYFKPCLSVLRAALCIQKDIFWTVLAMQHETLCAEHISVRYLRAGVSLNTSHKPFTTWWGKLLPLQSPSHFLSSISACLDTNRWKGGWTLHVQYQLIFLFYIFLFLSVVLQAILASISLVNWALTGKLISVTWDFFFSLTESIKLC